MAKRFYSVVTAKDNFIANIVNEDVVQLGKKSEEDLTPAYVKGFSSPNDVLVLTNIVMLLPNGSKVGILPFKDLAFGSEFVSVPVSSVSEIYFVNDNLSSQVSAALAGIELPSK